MSAYEFKVFQGADGNWYWHLVSGNGQIVAASEGYTRRRDAERSIKAIKVGIYRAAVGVA